MALNSFSDPLLQNETVRDRLTIPVHEDRVESYFRTKTVVEERFEVYSGEADIQQLNKIVSFNGNRCYKL